MGITSLAYIGIQSAKLGDWGAYATGLLGMQEVDRGGKTRAYRMDDLTQRLIVTGSEGESLGFIGWEVERAQDLDLCGARLEAFGAPVERGSRALAEERHVADLIITRDPGGNRVELAFAPHKADTPFTPGRAISGFKTGAYGMGHAVLHVEDVDTIAGFYLDALGFNLSDYGHTPYKLYFFHVNGRHHSFALVGSGQRGFHHFMVELMGLDDVGQGYDLACQDEGRVAYTLGRHTNDNMVSYYSHTPSGFFVEYGWGGKIIDPATWQPHETFDGPSYWGHERLYLPPEPRARLREMRLDAARRGIRAPECSLIKSILSKP